MVTFKYVGIVVFLLAGFKLSSAQQYAVPEVKFEALKAGGFRVSIPDIQGSRKFQFDANINEQVSAGSPGAIKGETGTPNNGVFIISFDNTLKVGDTVNYKVFVGFGRLGYRRENLAWIVTESDLHDSYAPLGPTCRAGTTTINGGKASCVGDLIIIDEFDGPTIDTSKWTVEQKIPTYQSVSNEINYYINSDDTRFLKDGILYLKPIPTQSEEEVRGELDLTTGCTSSDPLQCFHKGARAFIIPPVKSGRITSKIPFKYGKFEIKAKLPAGDWLVPVVQLQSQEKTAEGFTPKILLAYSRGNDHLIGSTGDDIGGRVLYAGPVLNAEGPGRNSKLKSIVATDDKTYSSDYHTFTLEWLPGKMSFYVDSKQYGTIDTSKGFSEFDKNWNTKDAPFNKECIISLGVLVGGQGEFPDDYKSGVRPRPWTYQEPSYARQFFNDLKFWLPTWKGDSTSLRVEYVKVWAI